MTKVDSKAPKRHTSLALLKPKFVGGLKTRTPTKTKTGSLVHYSGTKTSLPALNVTGPPVWVISFGDGDECGGDASIYILNKAEQTLERRLVLKCVLDLRPRDDDPNAYPSFVYTTTHPSGQLYMAIFKFDGALYREDHCLIAYGSDPEKFVTVKCDGRGVVNPQS